MNRHANFSTTSAGKLATTQATIRRLAFCFNGLISVLTQRFNAVLLNDSFVLEHHSSDYKFFTPPSGIF